MARREYRVMSFTPPPVPAAEPFVNRNQIEMAIRWLLATGGPGGAWLISHGYATQEQTNALLTVLIWLIGIVHPLVSLVWGYLIHTWAGRVKSAAQIPGVVSIGVKTSSPSLRAIAADPSQPKVSVGA
jgi:hypothetical protein